MHMPSEIQQYALSKNPKKEGFVYFYLPLILTFNERLLSWTFNIKENCKIVAFPPEF